jgi:serine O-acetyltransferase
VVIGAGAKVIFKLGQILTVGRGAVIGANAVVLSSVPPDEIWAGMPARKVSVRDSWFEGWQIRESRETGS